MRFTGTTGDDDFSGTAGKDKFDMSQGGNDTVFGQGGKDLFYFGAAFTADDQIDGGVLTVHHKIKVLGTVELNGDYSAGVVFGATTMTNIAHVVLDRGFSYNLTLNNATVSAGRDMVIDGLALGAGDSLIIDNSADTDGRISVKTNAGHVDLTGGAGFDSFYLGATLDATDRIDGGGSQNRLFLKGDYSGTLVLDSSWISHISEIQLGQGHYSFIAGDSFSDGASITINGGTDAVADFDASAETTARYEFDDLKGTLRGGAADDTFREIDGTAAGNGGNDLFALVHGTADGGDGIDTFDLVTGTSLGGAGNDIYANSTGTFFAGTGDDHFTECSGTFHLEQSGIIRFDNHDLKNGASSTLYFGATYTAADVVLKGAGPITAVFDGDYSQHSVLGRSFGVDNLVLTGGHDYNLETDDEMFLGKNGGTLKVDASTLGAGDSLTFTGTVVNGGRFVVTGGAGDDVINTDTHRDVLDGGAGDDILNGHGGGDTLTGGTGADVMYGSAHTEDLFIYTSSHDSVSTHYDSISGFDVAFDLFKLAIKVTGVDHAIAGGELDSTGGDAAFDADLSAALNGQLGAHHAVVFTPDSGNLAGDVFLIVDQNGIAGYQGGEDMVIRLDGGTALTDINLGNFE